MKYIESINLSLHQIFDRYDNAIIIGEDIKDPYGGAFKATKNLSSKFGDRVISTPISEAAITGLGIGLALNGYKPIVEIMFGDFITLCADQIINGGSKYSWMYGDQVKTPMIIRAPMGGRRGYGPTHSQSLESIFFNIPNLDIFSPSILNNPGKMLIDIFENSEKLSLFIENKVSYPCKIYDSSTIQDNKNLVINREKFSYASEIVSIILEEVEKPDVTIVTYGGMTEICTNVIQKAYMEHEIVVEVLSLSKIKPLEKDYLCKRIKKNMNRLLVVEEGYANAGWGSMFLAQFIEYTHHSLIKPPKIIGALNYPIGSSITLENKILPQEEDVLKKILKLME